jgi:hypothetical protein
MHKVLNAIEKLDGRHNGLAFAVKKWLDEGKKAREIQALLHRTFGVTATVKMVENFRSGRWAAEKNRIGLKTETTKAAVEASGGDAGFDSVVLAKLWESMDKMTVPQLLAARSLFVRIKAQSLKEQEFLYKTGQSKPKQADGQPVDPLAQQRKVLQRIKEIFGLATDEEPEPPPPAAAVAAGSGNAASPE